MNSICHEDFSIKNIFIPIRWIILLLLLLLVYAPITHGETPFYSIALSKFSNENDAKKEEAKLKNSGHNAFYRKEKASEYQIYIEKYNTRDEAEKEAMVLKDLELISDYAIREIKEIPQRDKKQNTPAKENNIDVLPIPQSAKVNKKPLNPSTKTKQQTTASENAPVINESKVESSASTNKTDRKTESPDNHDDTRLTGASLQVGSFKKEANAKALKIKLINLGKNAFYRHESTDSKGEFYRLYITGYRSLGEAVNDAKALVNSKIISSFSRVLSEESASDVPSETVEKKEEIYFIHISSNKDEVNARENVTRLKKYGYKAFYLFEKIPSGSWYRVYVGEFKDEAHAREKGMELIKRGLTTYFKPLTFDRKKLDN